MNPLHIPYDEGDGPLHLRPVDPPLVRTNMTYDTEPPRQRPSETDTDDDIFIVVPAEE
jgi:hypothetical protein